MRSSVAASRTEISQTAWLAKLEGTAARLEGSASTASPYSETKQLDEHAAWMEGWMEQDEKQQTLARMAMLENVVRQIVENGLILSADGQTYRCAFCSLLSRTPSTSREHDDDCVYLQAQQIVGERPSTDRTLEVVDDEEDVLAGVSLDY